MTANDMELGIETEIHGIIEDNGRIAIDAKIFSEIVRRLPDNDISIETDGTDSVKIHEHHRQGKQRGGLTQPRRHLTEAESNVSLYSISCGSLIAMVSA